MGNGAWLAVQWVEGVWRKITEEGPPGGALVLRPLTLQGYHSALSDTPARSPLRERNIKGHVQNLDQSGPLLLLPCSLCELFTQTLGEQCEPLSGIKLKGVRGRDDVKHCQGSGAVCCSDASLADHAPSARLFYAPRCKHATKGQEPIPAPRGDSWGSPRGYHGQAPFKGSAGPLGARVTVSRKDPGRCCTLPRCLPMLRGVRTPRLQGQPVTTR